MDLSPLPETRYQAILGNGPSWRQRMTHYVTQVIKAGARVVLTQLMKIVGFVRDHKTAISVLLAFAAAIYAVVWFDARETAKEKAAEAAALAAKAAANEAASNERSVRLSQNNTKSHQYLEAWTAAYQGSLEKVCYEYYSVQEPYAWTVSCHLGAKGSLPTHTLTCTELGCSLSTTK